MPEFYLTKSSQSYLFEKDKKYLVELWGAMGAGGGNEGYTFAVIQPPSNTTLYLYVGGSPEESDTPYVGGYNGGGNGGAIAGTAWSRGYGGGGATDIRTSTSTSSPQSYKILVAGGSGGGLTSGVTGGAVEDNGSPHPDNTSGSDERYETGGRAGTPNGIGLGAPAPYIIASGENYDTYYTPSGGGGGGGYFGGGGGSSGYIISASTRTFGAGNNGNPNGNGGTGGSYLTATSGGNSVDGGSGGGGSNYINLSSPLIKKGYTINDYVAEKPTSTYNGCARISPILSQPIVHSVHKEGDYFIVKIGKSENNGVEELFYTFGYFYENGTVFGDRLGIGKAYKIIGDEVVTLTYKIDKSKGGDRNFTFSMSNGDTEIKTEVGYKVSTTAPVVTFNKKSLQGKLMQGDVVDNAFSVTPTYEDIEYRTETSISIDNVVYPYTFNQGVDQFIIQMPYLFDGFTKKEYKLKMRTRACQIASNTLGNGKDIWSEWVESDEYTVYAVTPQSNNLKFFNNLKDGVIEKDSVISLSWGERKSRIMENKQYRVMFYEGDKVLQYFDTANTSLDVIMSYASEKHYRFGLSILIDGFLSEVVYTDEFYLTSTLASNNISFNNSLQLATTINTFNKIEVIVNDNTRIISQSNLNTELPIWYFKNGSNKVEVKVFFTFKDSITNIYEVEVAFDEETLVSKKILNITSTVSFNGQEKAQVKLGGVKDSAIDLGVAEKEMSTGSIDDGVIEEVTQRITVSKINQEDKTSTQLIEMLGVIE